MPLSNLQTHILRVLAASRRLKAALEQAERLVAAMPGGQEGLAYLSAGRVVEPDPGKLASYETIAGQRRGHWPSSPDIAGAMIERDPRL